MSITITLPLELERRIAHRATAHGKLVADVALEALTKTFDELENYEATLLSLAQVREGKTRPLKEFLEELRQQYGLPEQS
jgi:predicted DNA-binding protein